MEVTFSSVVEVLRLRANEWPDANAYTFLRDGRAESGRLTWGRMDRRAREIAARLQERRLTGERAILRFPPGLEFIAAFIGCLYAGVVAVPAYPPRSERFLSRLLSIVNDARPRAALAPAATLAGLPRWLDRAPELGRIDWMATDDLGDVDPGAWRDPGVGPESLAFLQYTSGSTASPKGVMVSHGNLLANERMIQRAFGQHEDSVVVGWLPLYHDRGLIGNVLQTLWSAGGAS